jgi:hypothetical protein
VISLDEVGPEAAKSYRGRAPVRPSTYDGTDGTAPPVGRAGQEIDYGHWGQGDVFGAFRPVIRKVCTQPHMGHTSTHAVAFLEQVEAWLPPKVQQVYEIVDHVSTHPTTNALLLSLMPARWEFVFQRKDAAHLSLIELWQMLLGSLALKARRFETSNATGQAVSKRQRIGTKHKHPFHWTTRGAINPVERPVSR